MNNFDLKEFYHQGYSFVGNIIKKDGINLLQKELDNLVEKKCKTNYSKILVQEDPDTGNLKDLKPPKKSSKVMTPYYKKILGLEHIELFRSILSFRVFKQIAEEVYGGIETKPYNYHVSNKPPKMGLQIPWHQNLYPEVDRQPIMRIIIAIDDMTKRKGCLQIIPGSHSCGIIHESGVPTEDQMDTISKKYDPIYLQMDEGDVVVLNNLCLQSSSINTTGKQSRSLSVCYIDCSSKIKK